MSQVQTLSNTHGKSVTPFSVATVIMTLLYVMPQTLLFVRNDMLAIIATLYYFVFLSKYVSIDQVFKVLLLGLPYSILYWIVGYSGNFKLGFVIPFMTLITLVMPCFAIIAVVKRNNWKEQKFISITTAISLLFVAITTFVALADNPLIMREMTGGGEYYITQARLRGVGSYGIAYSMGALFIAFWSLRRYLKKSFIPPIVYLVMTIVSGLLVVQSQFGTLLFITIGGVALHYFIEARTFPKRIMVLAVAIIVIISSQALIKMGMTMFGGEVLRYKFQLIYDGIWGGSGVENISGERSQVQLAALSFFLQSPVWGCSGVVFNEVFYSAHSTMIAVLAATGLIGFISYISAFYSAIKKVLSECFISVAEKRLYYPVVLFYLSFAFLNPIDFSFECSWVIFFVIPLLYIMVFSQARK